MCRQNLSCCWLRLPCSLDSCCRRGLSMPKVTCRNRIRPAVVGPMGKHRHKTSRIGELNATSLLRVTGVSRRWRMVFDIAPDRSSPTATVSGLGLSTACHQQRCHGIADNAVHSEQTGKPCRYLFKSPSKYRPSAGSNQSSPRHGTICQLYEFFSESVQRPVDAEERFQSGI